MHGIHRRPPRGGRLAELVSAAIRLLGRNRGTHNAPRRGDPFPTGPMEVYQEDPFAWMANRSARPARPTAGRYPRGQNPYPLGRNAETMVDMHVAEPRPYLNPVLSGGER